MMNSWTNQLANFSSSTSFSSSCQSSSNPSEEIQHLSSQYSICDMDCTPSSVSHGVVSRSVKPDKMDLGQDYPFGAVHQISADKFRHRSQAIEMSWWGDDSLQINNASNNNNTSTKSQDCVKSLDHCNPVKVHRSSPGTEIRRKKQWSPKHTYEPRTGYDQCRNTSDVPFGSWYEGGDYESDILRAMVPMEPEGEETFARDAFGASDMSVPAVIQTDSFANPRHSDNPTYSNLKVPTSSQQTLPPIALLAGKNDCHEVSETCTALLPSSVSPSSSGFSPIQNFSTEELSGAEYFMHDLAESPYQGAASNFSRSDNIPTGNDSCMTNPGLGTHHSAMGNLGNEAVSALEPIHRLKASRHKMTQRRLLHSLYQKKSGSTSVEIAKPEPRKRRPEGNRSSTAKSDTNEEKESDEMRTKKRLESNERERMRMHQLNDAFQGLRDICPHVKNGRKLSKIETLTLARNYILSLTEMIVNLEENKVDKSSGNATSLVHANFRNLGTQAPVSVKEESSHESELLEVTHRPLRRSNSTPSHRTDDINIQETDTIQSDKILLACDSSQAAREGQMVSEFESFFGLGEDREAFSEQ